MPELSNPPTAQTPSRWLVLDILRGSALAAMFVYHLVWDLGFFNLVPMSFALSPGFHAFGHAIAAVFLSVSGASFVLSVAHGGVGAGYWKRLGLLVAAALGVTLVTSFLFPQAFIFFGILHALALSSLLGLLVYRWPALALFGLGAGLVALPAVFSHTLFNAPWLWWTGLNELIPASNDYRPILPWFGVYLIGMGLMKAFLARAEVPERSAPPSGFLGLLAFGGRHSLLVYLVHQPVFLVLIWALSLTQGPRVQRDETAFIGSCVNECAERGASRLTCRSSCQCVAAEVKVRGFWTEILSNKISDSQQQQLSEVALACWKKALKAPPPAP